jgi:hypothetical protein
MYKNKEYVLGGPQVRVCGKLIVDNDLELATAAKNISAENTVSGSLLVSGETEFQKCQVSEDLVVQGSATIGENLTVDGNASLQGDLTVLGNLNAGLGLPVHVVQDPVTGRTMVTGDCFKPEWFTIDLIKTKQKLIDINDATEFKLLESGTYVIYFKYNLTSDNLNGVWFRFFHNGAEKSFFVDSNVVNDVASNRIFFIQTENADETISFDIAGIIGNSSVVTAIYPQRKMEIAVVKLA